MGAPSNNRVKMAAIACTGREMHVISVTSVAYSALFSFYCLSGVRVLQRVALGRNSRPARTSAVLGRSQVWRAPAVRVDSYSQIDPPSGGGARRSGAIRHLFIQFDTEHLLRHLGEEVLTMKPYLTPALAAAAWLLVSIPV